MTEFVWFHLKDGPGEEAIDLYQCRRFILQSYDPMEYSNSSLTYYLDKAAARWIRCRGDEEPIQVSGGWKMVYCLDYDEVCPEQAAYDFLNTDRHDKRLPKELEAYREFGDRERYLAWLEQSQPLGASTAPRSLPEWNPETLTLTFGSKVCRQFRRTQNNAQLSIIQGFADAGWPEYVDSPFGRNPVRTRQAVVDFNKKCEYRHFRLRQSHSRIGWSVSGHGGLSCPPFFGPGETGVRSNGL